MTEIVRVTGFGRAREAEVLEELDGGQRVRVRYVDTLRTKVVPASSVRRDRSATVVRKRPAAKRPELPPMMRGSDLLPPGSASGLAELRAVPKPRKPARSSRYLVFVRTKACLLCGRVAPSRAHHHGPRGMGEKTDDYRSIPLCDEDHDGYHTGNRPQLTPELVAHAQRELLVEYLRLVEGT